MAGWLSQFKLGRPGYEYSFTVNPSAMNIDEGPIDIIHRNLAGDLKKSIVKTSAPIIKIASGYFTKTQRDQFASLAGIADTFLSFQTRDDWQNILEKNYPTDTSHVTIQNTSATRLSAQLKAGGFSGIISGISVYTTPDGSGTEYFSGGSYDDSTRILTLGATLPDNVSPVFVTYTYKGWLVNMRKLSHNIQGGWVDRFQYDFQLEGA